MLNDSLLLSFLSTFSFISFFVILLIQKFFNKSDSILLDKDFLKPQAFHSTAVARSGGLAAIISLSIFFTIYYFIFDSLLIDYFFISFSFFLLGFLDDAKINISPKIRLILMISILSIFIMSFSITLKSVDLIFLNIWLSNNIFQGIFILFCFLFIINGANLIDGFNGLLGIHLLVINLALLLINLNQANNELNLVLIAQIVVLFSFLLFNFPKAKIFLGDGGSYLFGALLVLNVIYINNINPNNSSFFFCVILFYLFFEVFFSFFRKIYLKKSPLKPDNLHLHMLTYRYLKRLGKYEDCNYLNSLLINSVYTILIIPGLFFRENGLFCRYWFFTLLTIYLYTYFKLYNFDKKTT
ncbi:MAG: hypothetical protein CMI71_00390 [Candidatus Pelagibacter sp.]|nr:hypothetical protein [Candidatus Pelagibacter sp.]